eukprot:56743-Chlamydomonas_euryale.AAC.1
MAASAKVGRRRPSRSPLSRRPPHDEPGEVRMLRLLGPPAGGLRRAADSETCAAGRFRAKGALTRRQGGK